MRGWLSWHPSLYGSTFDGDVGGLKDSQQQPDLSQQQDSQPIPTTDGRPRRRSFGSHEASTYGAMETNGQVGDHDLQGRSVARDRSRRTRETDPKA